MLSKLKESEKVVGAKQLMRALQADSIACLYVANDADIFVNRDVIALCREKNIPVVEVPSKKTLGEACGIQVGCAAAGILKR